MRPYVYLRRIQVLSSAIAASHLLSRSMRRASRSLFSSYRFASSYSARRRSISALCRSYSARSSRWRRSRSKRSLSFASSSSLRWRARSSASAIQRSSSASLSSCFLRASSSLFLCFSRFSRRWRSSSYLAISSSLLTSLYMAKRLYTHANKCLSRMRLAALIRTLVMRRR